MKLVSPESLFVEQRRVLDNYVQFLPAGAVCINVVIGEAPWDIRPLFFSEGEVRIARFSDEIPAETLARTASEIEGFSLLFNKETSVFSITELERLLLIRPYAANTLLDELQQGLLKDRSSRRSIVGNLIKIVVALSQRSVVHGHLSPANIILRQAGELTLVDPVVGALSGTRDSFSAPELERGELPHASTDLYSLGRLAHTLLGDELNARQSSIVEQLLLPSPRQRPSLLELTLAFEVDSVEQSSNSILVPNTLTAKRTQPESPVESFRTEQTSEPPKAGWSFVIVMGVAVLSIIGLFVLKARSPAQYYALARYVPYLTNEYSDDYERDWASGQRSRMALVARAAVIRGEPAAINTIVNDISAGSNPPLVRAKFLRIALNADWRSELHWEEYRIALGLGLQELLPSAEQKLPPLAKLHPGILLAVLAETNPTSASRELKSIPLQAFRSLPEPFLSLFAALGSVGVVSLHDPRVIGMAALATGQISEHAIRAVLPSSMPTQEVILLVRILEPLVSAYPALANLLWEELSQRDDAIAKSIAWFGTFDIPSWDRVSIVLKLKTLTGTVSDSFSFTQLADLLTFPFSNVRMGAMKILQHGERALSPTVLQTVSSAGDSLKREQVVALLATLRVPEEKRSPFVTAWFEMRPVPDFVVLILLARNQLPTNDLLNLEAARYLRKSKWRGATDILSLMARHPEPLARMIAYSQLSSADTDQKRILKERLAVEDNPVCKKALREKIAQ